jgi:hypothetical protein
MRRDYEWSWGFSFRMGCDQIFREAMTAYMTDPDNARCVAAAIRDCLEKIEACFGEPGASGGPDCPPGTKESHGRCIPKF